MVKQLVAFSLLWSFVLFLAPVPAFGNFDSGDCTVGDSPVGTLVTSVIPACSNDSAVVEVVPRSYTDILTEDRHHSSLFIRIDYICIGNDGQQVRGTPWTTNHSDRRINVTNLDPLFDLKDANNQQFNATVQQSLQPWTNCTFYLCYRQDRTIPPFHQLGKASPVSCVTGDINECNITNRGCEHSCTNTTGSFTCSCDTGYQLDENELNCSDTDECNITNGGCEHNCTNTIGSFICSCDTGYQLDENELNCSDTDECNITNGGCEHNCTNTIGSFICSCDTGYQLDENELNCSDTDECNITNGGCEHNCTNTIGSFICSCETGYQLDENGLNCSDINECENSTNCHVDAQCTNTEGSFNCSCNPGYTGDGVNCMNINECELGTHTCNSNANCIDTDGSFNCTCGEGFEGDGFNCTDVSGVALLLAVFVPAVVLIMLISLLCVAISVVCKIRRREPTMFKVHKLLFKDDMLDLTYNPVSPFSIPKHTAFPSMTSVFDTLGTITATETQAGDTDTDSKSENIVPDPTNELTDTFLHKNSTSTTIVSPNNNLIASDSNQGYYDSNIPQSTDVVSMDKLMQTGSSISPPSYEDSEELCTNLVLEEDDQNNINSEADIRNDDGSEAEMSFIGSDYSDIHVGSRTSVVELCSEDHNDTAAQASVVQSNGYVHSENLLPDRHGSLDLNSHIVESESLHSISLEEAADPHSIPTMAETSKNEGYHVPTKQLPSSSGYFSDSTDAANCTSLVEPFSGDHNTTTAYNSTGQSSEHVCSENLLANSHEPLWTFDLNSHIIESESLHSISLVEAVDPPTITESPKNEGYYVQTKELPSLSGYLSNTVVSDTDAANWTSTIAADCNDTAPCNSARQSNGYVHSENTLADSPGSLCTLDLGSHIIESESLHSIPLEEAAELPSSSDYLSENTLATNCYSTSTVEPSTGDHHDTAACNSAGKNSECVHSEELMEVSYGSLHFNHNDELESSMYLDPQPITSIVEAEGYYTPAEKSRSSPGYLPNTHLLSSIEEKPDLLGLQSPGSSSKYFGIEDDLSMISSSEHYSTTTDNTFGYFNNTFQNFSSPFKVQHLSTSSGYITDYSKAEEELPYNANEFN